MPTLSSHCQATSTTCLTKSLDGCAYEASEAGHIVAVVTLGDGGWGRQASEDSEAEEYSRDRLPVVRLLGSVRAFGPINMQGICKLID